MTEEPDGRSPVLPESATATAESSEGKQSAEAKAAEAEKDRNEYFTQYWHYATNLRNWFIAYGVGCILLLTRADAVFNTQPPVRVNDSETVAGRIY
jgi:hypothetical protein